MATLQGVTASSWPAIDPESVEKVEAVIDDYGFPGTHGALTVEVQPADEVRTVGDEDDSDPDPHLQLYGYATFDVTKRVPVEVEEPGEVETDEYGYAEEFLTRLAPHLQEPLVIESVGYEKCRFPLLASQWAVWPDGTLSYNSFDHNPEKPSTDPQTSR